MNDIDQLLKAEGYVSLAQANAAVAKQLVAARELLLRLVNNYEWARAISDPTAPFDYLAEAQIKDEAVAIIARAKELLSTHGEL